MQAVDLSRGDLFIEETSPGYVWEYEDYDEGASVVLARRVLAVSGDTWKLRFRLSEHMNPYTKVKKIQIT